MVYILVMVSSTSGGYLLTLSPICRFWRFHGRECWWCRASRGEVVCGSRRCPNPTRRVFFLTWTVVLYFFLLYQWNTHYLVRVVQKKMLPKLRSLHEQMCCLSNLWFRTMNVQLFFLSNIVVLVFLSHSPLAYFQPLRTKYILSLSSFSCF